MIKRFIALMLCLIMAVSLLASCTIRKKDDTDKGAIINMYLSDEIYDFDPAYAFNNDSSLKIVNLLFSGLFRVNENGKVVKELAEDYRIDESKNSMIITIKEDAFWSDGTYVSANDVVYTFKRLLNPEFTSEAACLLYDVKNARTIKNATTDYYVDDIGVFPVGEREVEITFEEGFTNYDQFIENLASPALVPLREDIVSVNEGDWAKKPGTMACSGPFMLRKVSYSDIDKGLVLERNPYYFREDKDSAIDKSVTPYRIIVDYTKSAEDQYQMYLNGEIFYVGDIALSLRESANKVVLNDAMSTVSVYLNQNACFSKVAFTLDNEELGTPKESIPEDTGIKTITTTNNRYYTYYNHMTEEEYAAKNPGKTYQDLTDKTFDKKAYSYYKTVKTTEVTVNEFGETVHIVTEDREHRYTITVGTGVNALKYYEVDTPLGVKLFANENVRKALSVVIDREAIAKQVVYAKAANALIPYGVFGETRKDSFREEAGALISTTANKAEADSLIAASGIVPADFEILLEVKENDVVHGVIAESIKAAWESLGFKVTVCKVRTETNDEIGSTGEVSKDILDDIFSESIYNRTFHAAIIDFVSPTTRAFSMLAPFATDFAGTGMDLEAKDSKGNYLYEIEGHITGYKNDEYNAKIEEAFAEKDEEKRTALLIEAEKMLLEDMPVIPVVFNQDGYVISKELSKVDNSYFGSRIFTKTKLKDYEKYLPKTEG